MTQFIQNVAAADIPLRFHFDAGENSVLIQIMDPDANWWPTPAHNFKEIHRFSFEDIDKKHIESNPEDKGKEISDEQAAEIVAILQRALENKSQVVVHCHAGICRSGAVAEVGIMMGFSDTERFRSPNVLVKQKLMKVLGWAYDDSEKEDPDAWRNYRYDGEY